MNACLRPIAWGLAAAGLVLSLLSCSACGPTRAAQPLPHELIGAWRGETRVIVSWCAQEHLSLDLEIDASGAVHGTVGDATLVDGRLCRNRSALGRMLEVKTDWIIAGDLEGPLVAAESIVRRGVKIPCNLVAGELRGGLHSSGTHLGSADRMILSATDLVLARP